MKVTLLHPTRHDGRRYKAGESLEMERKAASALIDASAAEPFDPKPAAKADAGVELGSKAAAALKAKAKAESEAATKAAAAVQAEADAAAAAQAEAAAAGEKTAV